MKEEADFNLIQLTQEETADWHSDGQEARTAIRQKAREAARRLADDLGQPVEVHSDSGDTLATVKPRAGAAPPEAAPARRAVR